MILHTVYLRSFPGAQQLRICLQCRRHKSHVFSPWARKIFWRRRWQLLQYSCLENPMDRGAWQGSMEYHTVHGVAKSWTWLNTDLRSIWMKCLCWVTYYLWRSGKSQGHILMNTHTLLSLNIESFWLLLVKRFPFFLAKSSWNKNATEHFLLECFCFPLGKEEAWGSVSYF